MAIQIQKVAPVFKDPQLRRMAETINSLIDHLAFSSSALEVKSFTAAIQGGTTAGTYEIDSSNSMSVYYRVGDLIYLTVDLTLAATITGGGTGDLNITGLPVAKNANFSALGPAATSGINWTTGANLSCVFTPTFGSASTTLRILETNDDDIFSLVPISAVSGGDRIIVSIVYLAAN